MAKLRVRNFGPIKDGFSENDGFIEITPVTVICGNQAAGKSTIAKLYSTFVWLEKALKSEKITEDDITFDEFVNNYLSYHCIKSYISKNSEIDYIGSLYEFHIEKKMFRTKIIENDKYVKPKISYIPAERIFYSALPNAKDIVGILKNLFNMMEDFDIAGEAQNGEKYKLPIENYYYRYDSRTNKSYIFNGEDKSEIELYEAASGIQSIVPLSLLTTYYSNFVNNKMNGKRQLLSLNETKQIKKEYDRLVGVFGISALTSILSLLTSGVISLGFSITGLVSVFAAAGLYKVTTKKEKESINLKKQEKQLLIDVNNKISSIVSSCFINIVEEPEQNLYPESQASVLYELLECMNNNVHNQLLITTHSPYVLGVLNNCIYAGNLTKQGKDCSSIISSNRQVSVEKVSAYKIENGMIRSIISDDLKLINNSEIDGCSEVINSDYQKLEDIEFA